MIVSVIVQVVCDFPGCNRNWTEVEVSPRRNVTTQVSEKLLRRGWKITKDADIPGTRGSLPGMARHQCPHPIHRQEQTHAT